MLDDANAVVVDVYVNSAAQFSAGGFRAGLTEAGLESGRCSNAKFSMVSSRFV